MYANANKPAHTKTALTVCYCFSGIYTFLLAVMQPCVVLANSIHARPLVSILLSFINFRYSFGWASRFADLFQNRKSNYNLLDSIHLNDVKNVTLYAELNQGTLCDEVLQKTVAAYPRHGVNINKLALRQRRLINLDKEEVDTDTMTRWKVS